eukprot:gene17772-biopygen9897
MYFVLRVPIPNGPSERTPSPAPPLPFLNLWSLADAVGSPRHSRECLGLRGPAAPARRQCSRPCPQQRGEQSTISTADVCDSATGRHSGEGARGTLGSTQSAIAGWAGLDQVGHRWVRPGILQIIAAHAGTPPLFPTLTPRYYTEQHLNVLRTLRCQKQFPHSAGRKSEKPEFKTVGCSQRGAPCDVTAGDRTGLLRVRAGYVPGPQRGRCGAAAGTCRVRAGAAAGTCRGRSGAAAGPLRGRSEKTKKNTFFGFSVIVGLPQGIRSALLRHKRAP